MYSYAFAAVVTATLVGGSDGSISCHVEMGLPFALLQKCSCEGKESEQVASRFPVCCYPALVYSISISLPFSSGCVRMRYEDKKPLGRSGWSTFVCRKAIELW